MSNTNADRNKESEIIFVRATFLLRNIHIRIVGISIAPLINVLRKIFPARLEVFRDIP